MTGYRSLLSVLGILINVMLLAMTQKETSMLDEIADEGISFQAATSISLILMSRRLRTGSVSSISW